VRTDVSVPWPADSVRRVADPIVFVFATQLVAHAIWKTLSLPEPALPIVIELACCGFALSRIAAIGTLARQYRSAGDINVSRQPSIPTIGASAWTSASATMSTCLAASQVCCRLHRPHHRLDRRTRPRRRRSGPVMLSDVGR
jgi:hypothetical protein